MQRNITKRSLAILVVLMLVFTFVVAACDETGKFVNSLKLYTLLTNLGDNRSLISHPATTTHGQLSDEELLSIGITPGTLRISVGIEDIEDLIADFQQALQAIEK